MGEQLHPTVCLGRNQSSMTLTWCCFFLISVNTPDGKCWDLSLITKLSVVIALSYKALENSRNFKVRLFSEQIIHFFNDNVSRSFIVFRGAMFSDVQLSGVITRSNIVRYYKNDYRNWCKISIRYWIYKRHAIPGEEWGVFYWYMWEYWPRYNGAALYCARYIEPWYISQFKFTLGLPDKQSVSK